MDKFRAKLKEIAEGLVRFKEIMNASLHDLPTRIKANIVKNINMNETLTHAFEKAIDKEIVNTENKYSKLKDIIRLIIFVMCKSNKTNSIAVGMNYVYDFYCVLCR